MANSSSTPILRQWPIHHQPLFIVIPVFVVIPQFFVNGQFIVNPYSSSTHNSPSILDMSSTANSSSTLILRHLTILRERRIHRQPLFFVISDRNCRTHGPLPSNSPSVAIFSESDVTSGNINNRGKGALLGSRHRQRGRWRDEKIIINIGFRIEGFYC